MKIAIFSAAARETRSGNWVTASRWQRSLRSAGHHVTILHDKSEVEGCDADVLIGLHARRSGSTLLQFKKRYPERKTIVALSGTDIYRELSPTRKRHPIVAIKSLDSCDQIILLQPLMADRLKPKWRSKSTVVMMDVTKPKRVRKRVVGSSLNVCVVGHLRHEKDPLRAALAVRNLSGEVRVRVTHVGSALSDSFQVRASLESKRNASWNWLGSVEYAAVQKLMQESDLLVNASRAEGAPNVLFEAISCRLPIVASRIDGHVGVLGKGYPGYFAVGDTDGLQKLLVRCKLDAKFYQQLLKSIDVLAKNYRPGTELKSLLEAIENSIQARSARE